MLRGATNVAGTSYSSTLRMVEVSVVGRARCKRSWGGSIDDTMICAGDMTGGKDVCLGDSGGPLVVAGKDLLVGAVSFGKPCAQAKYPTVYSNVVALRDFIEAQS